MHIMYQSAILCQAMQESRHQASPTIGSAYRMDPVANPYCPVHEAIQVLQEKWTMHIVRALLGGPMGFNELGRTVGGCNPATLKLRLDRLEELHILERTVHSYMPPRTSYSLAPAGVDLQRVIDAIDRWGREHLDAGSEDGEASSVDSLAVRPAETVPARP